MRSQAAQQLLTDILGQPLGGGVVNGQSDDILAWKHIMLRAKKNLPATFLLLHLQVGILQRQEKMVIEATTNFACHLLENGKIEDQPVFAQRSFEFHQHAIVMSMQTLALATKGNKMRGTETQIAALDFDLAP